MRAIHTWCPGLSDRETADLAYWERNMLALRYAEGWYFDLVNDWPGYRRVLSLEGGRLCFHIPDDFPVGDLPQIKPNWNGHSTLEKWTMVLEGRGIKP